jgi:hypothetical protein
MVDGGPAVKDAFASSNHTLTASEFMDLFGVFPGGGTLDVTADYIISLQGNSVSGVGASLQIASGGISDDSVSSTVPISDGGTLSAHLDGCCFSPVLIRVAGFVSAGGGSSGRFSVAISEIKYNGRLVFSSAGPIVPEPASIVLAALGAMAAVGVRKR